MSKQWFVLHVQSRCEKKVAELLSEQNIEVYCPLVKEVKQWSDRKKTVLSPLFKSYVFVYLTEKERSLVFDVPGVLRYLFWLGKPAIVREEEMDAVKKWVSNDKVETLEIANLEPGKKVMIKQGILKDMDAVVQEVGNRRVRVVIQGMGVVLNIKLRDLV